MRRILHIIDSLGVGGAEKLLVGVINGLEGFEHHLMVLHGPVDLRNEITVPHHFVNIGFSSFRGIVFKSRTVRKYIREHKIDIVHSHLYVSNLVARLATPKSVCLVNSIHAISSLASYKINKISLWLEKLFYKKRHVLIAVSHAVLDDFDKWVGVKGEAHVVYNFIEDRFFQPPVAKDRSSKQLKLVAVGNLRWQKNYPYLLRAFRTVPQGVSLDIYGQGSLKDEFQKEIDTYGLPIRLMGVRDDLEKVLPGYDAFVMSSFYEGQPVSLLEAAASHVPAILSDIPVLREVLGNDAIYFTINDDTSFGKVIADIRDGKHDLNELAKGAAATVQHFARRKQYFEKLAAIYAKCLSYNDGKGIYEG